MRAQAAVLTVLAGAALAVPAAPAAAAACPQGPGVTVVVDFAELGGGEQIQCTGSDPSTGLAALRQAGFTPTRAAQQPGYFVCRINGKPANDPCQRTSPASAYWSYWHAKPGGTWTYSSLGAADYDPPPGTVEGWAFGAGKPPSSAPPRTAAPPSAAPSAAASPNPGSSRTAPARTPLALSPATTSPSRGAAAASSSLPVASTLSPPTSPASEPSAHPTESAPGTVQSRPNSYAGPVVAGLLVLAIAAAGVRRLRLRQRADRG